MSSSVGNNKGFALVLTLLIVSLILVLTLQFNNTMWAGLYSSTNLSDGIRLNCVARSGINCALAVLSEDAAASDVDSLQEPWAQSKELSLNAVEMFENSRFQVEIVDLSGKIPINRLVDENGEYNEAQKALLARFLSLESFKLESETVGNLIDAIKDWIDPDGDVTRFGAESGYYQSLENPYACSDGPMDSVNQLLQVKGMTRELFYGTDQSPGISGHLTVRGDGKINVNTAGPLVLQALSEDMDADMVEDMTAYRLNEKNELTDPLWYRSITGMGHVQIEPDLIKTSSDDFEVVSTGMAQSMTREIRAVVKRGQSSVQIVSWKAE